MMHPTITPLMMHCTRNDANNCHNVPTIVSLSRHLYPGTLPKYLPDNHDRVPMTRVFVYDQSQLSTYRVILIVRTHQ
jgi:hypothetical protein